MNQQNWGANVGLTAAKALDKVQTVEDTKAEAKVESAEVAEVAEVVDAGKTTEVAKEQAPASETELLRLVGIQVERVPMNAMTVAATRWQYGVIITGPTNRRPAGSKDDLIRSCRGYRWVLKPVEVEENSRGQITKITDRPSIYPFRRYTATCPSGHMKLLRHDQIRSGKTIFCQECKKYNPEKKSYDMPSMKIMAMRTSLLPLKGEDNDPVLPSLDCAELGDMMEAWHKPPKAMTVSLVLPRIWAVYPRDNDGNHRAPTDWSPSVIDAKAVELAKRVGDPKVNSVIRPFSHAYKSQHQEIRTLLLEAETRMVFGWVRESDLRGSEIGGFKRRFLKKHQRRQQVWV